MPAKKEPAKRNRRRVHADGTPRKRLSQAERNAVMAAKKEIREELKRKGYEIVPKRVEVREASRARGKTRLAAKRFPRCEGFDIVGDPCKNAALEKGSELEGVVVSGRWCLYHEDDVPESTARRFRQEGNQAIPLPKRVTPAEVAAAAFERAPYYLLEPYFEALGLEIDPHTRLIRKREGGGAKIVGFSREGVARVSKHENIEIKMRAAKELAERLYGKPRTAVNLAGDNAGSIIISMPSDPDHYNSVARVLIETGAVPNGNGNGHVEKTDQNTIESTSEEVLDE